MTQEAKLFFKANMMWRMSMMSVIRLWGLVKSLVTRLDQLFLRKIHSLDPNYQWLLISVYETKTCLDLAWIWTCSYKGCVATTTVVTGLWFHMCSWHLLTMGDSMCASHGSVFRGFDFPLYDSGITGLCLCRLCSSKPQTCAFWVRCPQSYFS